MSSRYEFRPYTPLPETHFPLESAPAKSFSLNPVELPVRVLIVQPVPIRPIRSATDSIQRNQSGPSAGATRYSVKGMERACHKQAGSNAQRRRGAQARPRLLAG